MAFRVALPILPYREPEIVSSCSELGKLLKKENIKSVLIVTDKGIINNGLINPLQKVLNDNGVADWSN